MNGNQHIKSVNTDSRVKNRLRYSSNRERAKKASADVYRSYKRKIGVTTSAAGREERVHNPEITQRSKRNKKGESISLDENGAAITFRQKTKKIEDKILSNEQIVIEDIDSNTFAQELDLAFDRNASEIYGSFYREIFPLARSLPEILHHSDKIISVLLSYILSPEEKPGTISSVETWKILRTGSLIKRNCFVPNLATTDILHLLSVLARDLRHEIHPFLHTQILPRIIYDLLNPPAPMNNSTPQFRQPLDISLVECAFRTISYIFKYDMEEILSEEGTVSKDRNGSKSKKKSSRGCLEPMRAYYGVTLAHKQDYVKRLAAETFAPLVRKIRTDSGRNKHIRRILRALAISVFPDDSMNSLGEDGSSRILQSAQRVHFDAIEGISCLIFNIMKGVPGQLHSKATGIMRTLFDCLVSLEDSSFDKKKKNKSKQSLNEMKRDSLLVHKREVVFKVISHILFKIRGHIKYGKDFSSLWKELYCFLDLILDNNEKKSENTNSLDETSDLLNYILQLLESCVTYRDGYLMKDSDDELFKYDNSEKLSVMLQKLLQSKNYDRLAHVTKMSVVKLFCSAWKSNPRHPGFSSRLRFFFSKIANQYQVNSDNVQKEDIDPAVMLTQDLLPYLPFEDSIQYLVPAILATASQISIKNPDHAVTILHLVCTSERKVLRGERESTFDDDDNLFETNGVAKCFVSERDRSTLLNLCLFDFITSTSSHDISFTCSKVGYVARCIPFLLSIKCKDISEKSNARYLKCACDWFVQVSSHIDTQHEKSSFNSHKNGLDIIVAKSLLLESVASLYLSDSAQCSSDRELFKTLLIMKGYANQLLVDYPKLLWTTRSISVFIEALSKINERLKYSSDEVFDLLIPNLQSRCHFLRKYTLKILNSYPDRPFITDHADLDLIADLDEEPSFNPKNDQISLREQANQNGASTVGSKSTLSGMCTLMKKLLILETTSLNIQNERNITSSISAIEVLGRTGKLPIIYAEAATNHMLGLLHLKFQPLWKACIRTIISLVTSYENNTWSSLESKIRDTMELSKPKEIVIDTANNEDKIGKKSESIFVHHHQLCLDWEKTQGANPMIFGDRTALAEHQGRVSRHQFTDDSTIFESVWSVMEGIPHVTTRKSKTIVPIFLNFLQNHYYHFNDNDHDAIELNLVDHVDKPHCESWPKKDMGRRALQTKLKSFLKMFAAVKGPQQLYKNKLLLSIFKAFLSNPDFTISQLSLSCISNFKLSYIMPYQEQLKAMLQKTTLRDSLVKFNISRESGIVENHDREMLIPVIIRILFGRLAARAISTKSSKDSPSARRTAILSFLSPLGKNEGELDYFIYMMIRVFIPKQNIKKLEADSTFMQCTEMIRLASACDDKFISQLNGHRIEGFLNLLGDVISSLGFGVQRYVSCFIPLLLSIAQHTENFRKLSESDVLSGQNSENSIVETESSKFRIGTIRSLCYRRISEIFSKFGNSVDFMPFSIKLWSVLDPALKKLAGSVVGAKKAPSLLVLLESISTHASLFPLLQHHNSAVIALLKCISVKSEYDVIDRALRFIDNLLTDGLIVDSFDQNYESTGVMIVKKNIELLIAQFSKRLQSGQLSSSENVVNSVDKLSQLNKLQYRELSILCHISSLISTKEFSSNNSILEKTCSTLTHYLNFERNINERSLCDVLKILSKMIPQISMDAAMSHLQIVSKLLGPKKSGPGILFLETRQMIASVITSIADRCIGFDALKTVANSLQCLSAAHPKHIDEHNFDDVLPVLNALCDDSGNIGGWSYIARLRSQTLDGVFQFTDYNIKVLVPLMCSCLHYLYDTDGVLSRGSFNALKVLIKTAGHEAKSNPLSKDNTSSREWIKLIEFSLIPYIKAGLKTKSSSTRRLFLLLMSSVARSFSFSTSVHLYGDLNLLIRDDDPEVDFFINMTHVQLHRQSRALLRLRKLLSANTSEEKKSCQKSLFSTQTMSNVLLPLALHPIYESKENLNESYILEAIATASTICEHLPWGKYQSQLSTVLLHISRFPEKEKHLVMLLCGIIDAYHFPIEMKDLSNNEADEKKLDIDHVHTFDEKNCEYSNKSVNSAIWRSLKNRLIPKIESLLIKDKFEKGKDIEKVLCAPIALALVKLYQKLPQHIFVSKLPGILTAVCISLKNKESNDRDKARETLSKIASSIDMKYLGDVIRELATTLKSGYQLHIRSATLHSVLVAVSKVYILPSEKNPLDNMLPFDLCVPAMMDLIQQDVFGVASEMKEAEHIKRRVIKEAMGVKSYHSLEIISRFIEFNPMKKGINFDGQICMSSIHCLIAPFLERLRDPEVEKSVIGKAKECLNRIVLGLSKNNSSNLKRVLPFVFRTLTSFIHESNDESNEIDSVDSDEDEKTEIHITKKRSLSSKPDSSQTIASTNAIRKVSVWTPSSLSVAKTRKLALEMKLNDQKELRKVKDGVYAPKLTGKSRYKALKSKTPGINNPAVSNSVAFGLKLLHSCLKNSKLNVKDLEMVTLIDSFIPLLTHCVQYFSDSIIISLSLKCLIILIRMDLPSIPKQSKTLGGHCLRLLTMTGATSKTQSEMIQICFKMLTILLTFSRQVKTKQAGLTESNEKELYCLPLDDQQMQVLVSFLQNAITDYEHHHATFGLIKSITSINFIAPQFYDLMELLLKLTVQSQRDNIREQSRIVFLQYLIEYPMGQQKLESHLKQIVLNLNYEYESGRLSAMKLLEVVIGKIPIPLLQEHSQLFFLPLVLQLVNDESKQCREYVAGCILLLLKRLPLDSLQSLYGYVIRWANQKGAETRKLRRTSAQLFGIFIDAREDFFKKGKISSEVIHIICVFLSEELGSDYTDILLGRDWEVSYFCLMCAEKINNKTPVVASGETQLWKLVIKCLAHSHPWIQRVSSRIINSHLSQLEVKNLTKQGGTQSFLLSLPGSLFQIARNLCYQLNTDEKLQNDSINVIAIKSLTWVLEAMEMHPNLCFGEDVEIGPNDNIDNPEELEDVLSMKKPVLWLMMRLSNIAKSHGSKRRESIFKCFAAFIATCDTSILIPHLNLMIEPLHREISENASKTLSISHLSSYENNQKEMEKSGLAQEVLQLIEDKCGSGEFLKAYVAVKKKATQKRDRRKQDIASEAIRDPEIFAKRKVLKNKKKRSTRKRKIEERRKNRGAFIKKSRYGG